MKDATEIKVKLNKWFSGLPLETMQRISTLVSTLLADIDGIKTRRGNQCQFVPCGRREYVRKVCGTHYGKIVHIRKLSGENWLRFVRMGLCGPTKKELRQIYQATEPNPNDPLRVLIRNNN